MEWFYLTVLAIAIILLIIMLTFIGTRIVNNDQSENVDTVYPPIQNSCPDLWNSKTTGDTIECEIPSDSKNIGHLVTAAMVLEDSTKTESVIQGLNTEKTHINFSSWSSSGKSNECAKKEWADINNIFWDGVSNYNQC